MNTERYSVSERAYGGMETNGSYGSQNQTYGDMFSSNDYQDERRKKCGCIGGICGACA